MPERQESYVDFDLHISPQGHVIASSPEGQAEADILTQVPNQIRLSLKLIDKNQADADLLKEMGRELYGWLFPASIHTHIHQTEAAARAQGARVRLRLRIEPESIASLPLEFLYRAAGNYYLAVNPGTPLSRYLHLPLPPERIRRRDGPLHMLALIAAPEDQPRLDPDEWETLLHESLAGLLSSGAITLRSIKQATLKEIRGALRERKPDIVQFFGHGIHQDGKGYLALVDEDKDTTWLVDDERFANLFLGFDDRLELVSLAACESAHSGDPQGFRGIAPQLVQRGVPAVLAMQYKLLIRSARVFFEDFYASLAASQPVDWAIQAGRSTLALKFGLGNREFATPVLYMRAPDGILFDLAGTAQPAKGFRNQSPPKPKRSSPGEITGTRSAAPAMETLEKPGQDLPGPAQEGAGTQEAAGGSAVPEVLTRFTGRLAPSIEPERMDDAGIRTLKAGEEVTWTVTVQNIGNALERNLNLLRERALLNEESFDLAPGEARQFSFTAIYPQAGGQMENVRLLGRDVDMLISEIFNAIRPPGFTLALSADRETAHPGETVNWTARLANDGGANLLQVIARRERELLEEPFDLPVGAEKRLGFQRNYDRSGEFLETVTAAGFTLESERIQRQVQGAIKIASPDRLVITKPLDIELIRIPAGEFLMGSEKRKDSLASENELPQHRLFLQEYFIGKFPVTNDQYEVFVQATNHPAPSHWEKGRPPKGNGDHPVVNVSWRNALAFCRWLAEQTGKPFTLPTEAEWEKAARGADGRIYPWGDEWDPARCNTSESKIGGTTPVGKYSPLGDSPSGCADMAGNVWEWTHSLYMPYPYDPADGRENIGAPGNGARVVRGGSWDDGHNFCRPASRDRDEPEFFYKALGFRLALSPS